MRHSFAGAPAADSDPQGERERDLKAKGVAMATAVGNELVSRKDDPLPSVIFTSPFQRAVSTADIMGGILGIRVNVVDDLAPNRPLDDRLLELMSHGEVKRIMVVGHHDNTTPAFNNFGGKMGPEKRDDDDDLRAALGYQDGTTPGDAGDNPDGDGDWVPLVMGEIRRLSIGRRSGKWKVRTRIRPSDIGLKDIR